MQYILKYDFHFMQNIYVTLIILKLLRDTQRFVRAMLCLMVLKSGHFWMGKNATFFALVSEPIFYHTHKNLTCQQDVFALLTQLLSSEQVVKFGTSCGQVDANTLVASYHSQTACICLTGTTCSKSVEVHSSRRC